MAAGGAGGSRQLKAGCKQNHQTFQQQLPYITTQRLCAAGFAAGSQQHLHTGIFHKKGLEKDVLK